MGPEYGLYCILYSSGGIITQSLSYNYCNFQEINRLHIDVLSGRMFTPFQWYGYGMVMVVTSEIPFPGATDKDFIMIMVT